MNEGWACFWHYTLLNHLYDDGYINDAFMMEILQSHTNVIYQPGFDSPYYSGINPYALGYKMMTDLRRICEHPTSEDRQWFSDIAGSDWLETLDFAMRNFKDESFIAQYLSPTVMRDMKLFNITDDDAEANLEIEEIHNEVGYQELREALAAQYNLGNREPNIQVYEVDLRGDRSLTLHHTQFNRKPLAKKNSDEVLRHIYQLWKFPVRLHSIDEQGEICASFECPKPEKKASPVRKTQE